MSDYQSRKRIVWKSLLVPMQSVFGPPRNIKDNKEGQNIYLESLFEAVNGSISGKVPTDEQFEFIVNKISKEMISKASVRVWYLPNDLKRVSVKVGSEWLANYQKEQRIFGDIYEPEKEPARPSKDDAAGNGWTWDKLAEHRARLQADALDPDVKMSNRTVESFTRILDSVEQKLLARERHNDAF